MPIQDMDQHEALWRLMGAGDEEVFSDIVDDIDAGKNIRTIGTGGGAVSSVNGQTGAVDLSGTYVEYKALAAQLDTLITGAITRDANGAATSAPVVWPDGTPGTYTATTVSTAFPGAVDAYTVTYGSPVTKTYTQPAVTRDASTGAVTNRPAITVA